MGVGVEVVEFSFIPIRGEDHTRSNNSWIGRAHHTPRRTALAHALNHIKSSFFLRFLYASGILHLTESLVPSTTDGAHTLSQPLIAFARLPLPFAAIHAARLHAGIGDDSSRHYGTSLLSTKNSPAPE